MCKNKSKQQSCPKEEEGTSTHYLGFRSITCWLLCVHECPSAWLATLFPFTFNLPCACFPTKMFFFCFCVSFDSLQKTCCLLLLLIKCAKYSLLSWKKQINSICSGVLLQLKLNKKKIYVFQVFNVRVFIDFNFE